MDGKVIHMPGRLLTAAQAADILGIAPKTIRNWGYLGRLQVVKIGRCARYLEGEVRTLRDEAVRATARSTAQNGM